MKYTKLVRSLAAAGIIVLGVGGFAGARAALDHSHDSVPVATAIAHSSGVLPDFSDIVAQNGPAVVNISVTGIKAASDNMGPFSGNVDPNNPFSQFFQQFGTPTPQVPVRGEGSGFIVSPDGVILTNAHVVDGAKTVTVKLTDKREFQAKVVGEDKLSDIAVLRIGATNLPTVRLDTADNVKVGQWVVAIGSPFGFENSATAGIVSAKSRALPNDSYPFIQTDVAVNPGNSGGPLFNSQGEVVGINSQIYTRSGGFQGISFAIPINEALHVKDELLAHGSVTRGQLGVTVQDVTQDLSDAFGLKQPTGALVSSVIPDSGAEKAGVKPGDVIVGYNGHKIVESSDLPMLVANTTPGAKADLEIMRNGQDRNVNVTLGQLAGEQVASADQVSHGRLGVAVRKPTADERASANLSGGLVVESASGAAADAGIQAGDVILSMNGTSVNSPEQLKQMVDHSGKHVALLIERDQQKMFVPVDLG